MGRRTLIWPLLGQGNQDNLFPAPPEDSEAKATPPPIEIAISGKAEYDFEVGEPYGNDTYLVLTSVQRIDNPDIFDFEGVRSKAPQTRGAGSNPLEELLAGIGTTASRGPIPRVPTDWNLEPMVLHSEPPQGK